MCGGYRSLFIIPRFQTLYSCLSESQCEMYLDFVSERNEIFFEILSLLETLFLYSSLCFEGIFSSRYNFILSRVYYHYFVLFLLTLILRRSRTGTVWFYTSTSNKRAARPKLYTESLTRDLKRMYSRFTLVRISINLQAPRFFHVGTGVSLLSRQHFLYI